jgi:hypothetical protein
VLLPAARACDHESRCSLRVVRFGVERLASAANVQDCLVRRRVRNSPIKKRSVRIHRRCYRHCVRPAAIQREPKLDLTDRPIDWLRTLGAQCRPLNPDVLSRMQNLASARRNQPRKVVGRWQRECPCPRRRNDQSQQKHGHNEAANFHFWILPSLFVTLCFEKATDYRRATCSQLSSPCNMDLQHGATRS